MRDEDLREEFAAWLRPVREAEPPALPVIRRRLRRRRTRQAIGGTAAFAAAAGLAVVISTTSGAPQAPAGPPDTAGSAGPAPDIAVITSSPRLVRGEYRSTSSYTVSSPVSTLVVNGEVGTITITGSQRPAVSVSEQAIYSDHPPDMTRKLTGKTLTLGYQCSDCGVSYDIQVPRGLTVEVTSGTGDIRLSSLSGSVDASSNVGAITADGLSSGAASFTSDVGAINAVFTAAPATVHAAAGVGGVTIRVPGSATYQVNIPSGGLGTPMISVPESATSRHVINASSNEGPVVIAPSS